MRTEQEIIADKLAEYIRREKDMTEGYRYFQSKLALMEQESSNTFNRPVASQKPGVGALVVLFKKSVRRLVSWYNNPFAAQQTAFNTAAVDSTAYLGQTVKQLQEENLMLAERVSKLEDLVWQLQNEDDGSGKA